MWQGCVDIWHSFAVCKKGCNATHLLLCWVCRPERELQNSDAQHSSTDCRILSSSAGLRCTGHWDIVHIKRPCIHLISHHMGWGPIQFQLGCTMKPIHAYRHECLCKRTCYRVLTQAQESMKGMLWSAPVLYNVIPRCTVLSIAVAVQGASRK